MAILAVLDEAALELQNYCQFSNWTTVVMILHILQGDLADLLLELLQKPEYVEKML